MATSKQVGQATFSDSHATNEEIATRIVKASFDAGSTDNISSLVITF